MARKLVLSFLFPNLLAIIFVFTFPGKPVEPNLEFLMLLNSIFVLIVLLCALFSFYFFSFFKVRGKNDAGFIELKQIRWNAYFLTFFPLLGLVFLVYDRIFLRGIDYTQALRAARYEWLASEGGSIFGIVGNILIPLGYISIFFVAKYFKKLSRLTVFAVVASSLISIFGHAFLNGGRSNILLYFVMMYVAYCISDVRIRLDSLVSKRGFIISLLVAASIFYVGSVTYSSASIGGVDIGELLQLVIYEMYGKPDEKFFSVEHSSFIYIFLYFFLYLFHGQWTTQIAYGLTSFPGFHSIVSAPTVFLDGMGIINLGLNVRAFSDTGAFVSLPGSFYYDFGWLGVVLGSMVLGFLFGLVLAYLKNNKCRQTLGMIFVVAVVSVLILSPILPVYGFSYFSFIPCSFFFLAFFNLFFFRKAVCF